ncbi:MAG: hypothetical protein COV71_00665 [Candidatus Omnitrophica bacterium CG11_big_fil_rev_8_21_14_0_20_41_12]|nr:MAG: hypothetical protein COV71_00665 [Candidatus Omnitrophica bacterium CG11_big_fil_rev_8_21_14_0_20_41_12]
MHDIHILKNIFKYLQEQEDQACRKLKKVHFSISEFGNFNQEHFLEHYRHAVRATRFQGLEIAVKTIPFGPELEITGLEFAGQTSKEE